MTDNIASLSRTRSVLHVVGDPADNPYAVTYRTPVDGAPDDVPSGRRVVTLPREVVEDMGHPTVITVTVEPGDALNDLANARAREAWAREDVIEQVREARRNGKSWADVARAFGCTRQAAWERFAHHLRADDAAHRP